ncbi:LOW QUALITY PROTEIN: sorting nexin-15 [Coregonus clupeaformis]|uniref:LOW QUALITY PROTEIN: sorting nexin-15 n=1 Tax=Coregonus clupeaformis TaxID=59861 RepID=UPI001E1C6600|nr:LOW QUALITY PROTEIN: sorting nexin-15 [Coregonus clupeaformis]
MSRKKEKEEYYRFFSVTEPRTHEKGHTEYKVTARFVSKRHPEDVKEVLVWRRYSELKKLHGELSYTHRNLFRRQEEFPPFPGAQLFGRFDEGVIEERRSAAEAMLLFTTNIPALYNSPQLKDFFRCGEVIRPLDPSPLSASTPSLPPLIPLPHRRGSDCEPEEEGTEGPIQTQNLGLSLGTDLVEPEVATEAYSEMGASPTPAAVTPTEEEEEEEELTDLPDLPGVLKLDDRVPSPFQPCVLRTDQSQSQEEFDLLFDSVMREEPTEEVPPPPLSDNDLAIFDPCAKEDQPSASHNQSELLSLPLTNPDAGEAGYLRQAANELTAAMASEKEGEYSTAIQKYKTAVDLLITGVKGDPDPQRRGSVKRRTAQYLEHAETLVTLLTSTHTSQDSHTHTEEKDS